MVDQEWDSSDRTYKVNIICIALTPLKIMYATTESGKRVYFSIRMTLNVTAAVSFSSLVTETDHLPSMRPFKGVGCTLIPLHMKNAEELDNLHEKRATGGQLYDLFIPAEADNCPHPSIRNRPDGHITGDVFEETGPGFYAFRESRRPRAWDCT